MFCNALSEHPTPQSIPEGFGSFFDWPSVSDEVAARRGWVRFAPPVHDPVHERIETTFAKGEDGVWTATYAVVAGPAEPALAIAKAAVAARRWAEQARGVTVAIAGTPTRFLSTKEGQTDIGNALQLGTAADARHGAEPGSFSMTWKSLDGFVVLKVADLVAIGMAIGAHVAACFAREGAIDTALIDAATAPGATAYAVRDTLAAEIDRGWPA